MLPQQLYQVVRQGLCILSLAIGTQINRATQGTGGIYFIAVRTCLSHEGDNLTRFTPTMEYSNHSMDFRISHI